MTLYNRDMNTNANQIVAKLHSVSEDRGKGTVTVRTVLGGIGIT